MEKNDGTKNIISEIEAVLFIYGEPIQDKKLAKLLGVEDDEFRAGIEELKKELEREERGLSLIEDKGKIQLVTKPAFSSLLEDMTKQEFTENLSPATLETLSIICYAGPISRADIEYIRGVNSSFILRTLVMRGLVEREVNPKRANAYVYSTSFDLLRYLGLSKVEDLPDYKKYKDLTLHLYHELEDKDKKQENKMNIEGEEISAIESEDIEDVPAQESKNLEDALVQESENIEESSQEENIENER
ncbi:SMC-Scp complex subunit ScpB [Candidatus Nomurabacteria bacterium CG10_big_fil_rev_8_21_14_0_10_35_16]|uniref:SMC-Scp complex subunit ScpB n=1 Tax=Candidatus Nomurabacteria bacterium CG10_big_fil_rev_8_21_14_0_10_35_16 TaxID=1974731 RepID=A0A2H0TBQ1_9BACT|nr:MAG: SMC-Scp complex subunit ScpB [Candidatus Nomurabacteria bacterium CG10_big_fil_rev_8_21_14_0_10_35_16]